MFISLLLLLLLLVVFILRLVLLFVFSLSLHLSFAALSLCLLAERRASLGGRSFGFSSCLLLLDSLLSFPLLSSLLSHFFVFVFLPKFQFSFPVLFLFPSVILSAYGLCSVPQPAMFGFPRAPLSPASSELLSGARTSAGNRTPRAVSFLPASLPSRCHLNLFLPLFRSFALPRSLFSSVLFSFALFPHIFFSSLFSSLLFLSFPFPSHPYTVHSVCVSVCSQQFQVALPQSSRGVAQLRRRETLDFLIIHMIDVVCFLFLPFSFFLSSFLFLFFGFVLCFFFFFFLFFQYADRLQRQTMLCCPLASRN